MKRWSSRWPTSRGIAAPALETGDTKPFLFVHRVCTKHTQHTTNTITTMNITTLPKDELISHTAEILTTQDRTIDTLRAEVRVLQVIAAVLLAMGVLF